MSSDVRVELSGSLSQQLDSLISNSMWMRDTGRLRDFYLCTPRGGTRWSFYLRRHAGDPFKTLLYIRAEVASGQLHCHSTQCLRCPKKKSFYLRFQTEISAGVGVTAEVGGLQLFTFKCYV